MVFLCLHVACAAVLLEPVSCPLLLVPRRAEAMAAMDVTQTQQQQRHFCKGDLEGVEGDDVTKWPCGHSAHTDCLQENCLRRGVPVPNNCPFCDGFVPPTQPDFDSQAAMATPAAAPESAGEVTPEPLPLTQGGNPVPRVYLSDMTRAADEAVAAPDPLTNWLETFLTLSEEDDLLQHLHCQDLFQGIGTGDGCYATVRQWLQEIWEDDREHREVAADSRFTTRTLLPKPFEISLRAVARKEGWETETLMAPFLGNIGWMESPGVRLRLREDEEQKRSCVVQVVCAGEPSMRKSSLKDFAAKTLLSHADVPETLRTGAAWSSDGTVKGIRGSIQEHSRAGLVSDEIANTYAFCARPAPQDGLALWQQGEVVHMAQLRGRQQQNRGGSLHIVRLQLPASGLRSGQFVRARA